MDWKHGGDGDLQQNHFSFSLLSFCDFKKNISRVPTVVARAEQQLSEAEGTIERAEPLDSILPNP